MDELNKNVEFIISIDSNNNERIIPIEQFNEFFYVKTILRRKKSRSSRLPKRYYEDFMDKISKKFKVTEYSLYEKENRLYVETKLNLSRENLYIESEIIISAKNINSDTFTIQSLIDYINQEENNN